MKDRVQIKADLDRAFSQWRMQLGHTNTRIEDAPNNIEQAFAAGYYRGRQADEKPS